MKKKEVAKRLGTTYPTFWHWTKRGVPSARVDSVAEELIKKSRQNGCPIQGSPYQIKLGIQDASYFKKCLKMAFPGTWVKGGE